MESKKSGEDTSVLSLQVKGQKRRRGCHRMWKNRGGQKGGVSWATWAESKGYVCPRKP